MIQGVSWRALAAAGQRRLEDAVVDWARQAVSQPAIETLSDDALLELCDATLEADRQEELSGLLGDAREGALDTVARARLDNLTAHYRHGLVLKARAWKEAVARRGLRMPPTNADAGADHAE